MPNAQSRLEQSKRELGILEAKRNSRGALWELCLEMGNMLEGTPEGFDRKRFLLDCGMQQSVSQSVSDSRHQQSWFVSIS